MCLYYSLPTIIEKSPYKNLIYRFDFQQIMHFMRFLLKIKPKNIVDLDLFFSVVDGGTEVLPSERRQIRESVNRRLNPRARNTIIFTDDVFHEIYRSLLPWSPIHGSDGITNLRQNISILGYTYTFNTHDARIFMLIFCATRMWTGYSLASSHRFYRADKWLGKSQLSLPFALHPMTILVLIMIIIPQTSHTLAAGWTGQ